MISDDADALLVLVYGMACPLRCDFCCHPVEDYGGKAIGVDRAVRYIEQAKAHPNFFTVCFTGGEPFLYHRDLLTIFQRSLADRQLAVRVVTSAHFATTVDAARTFLQPFVDAGLTELSISTDDSHQKYVAAVCIENAANAGVDLGLVVEVSGVFWEPGRSVRERVNLPTSVMINDGLVVPIGRARRNLDKYPGKVTPAAYRLDVDRLGGCSRGGLVDVTVYPNGNVYPCCSGGSNIEGKLELGNLDEDSLDTVYSRLKADAFLEIVLSQGTEFLANIVRFRFPELASILPDTRDMVSVCQACSAMHRDDDVMAKLQPALAYGVRVLRAASRNTASRNTATQNSASGNAMQTTAEQISLSASPTRWQSRVVGAMVHA